MCPVLMLVAIGGEAIGREVGGTGDGISVGVAVGIGVIEAVGVMLGVGVTDTTATDNAPSVGYVLPPPFIRLATICTLLARLSGLYTNGVPGALSAVATILLPCCAVHKIANGLLTAATA